MHYRFTLFFTCLFGCSLLVPTCHLLAGPSATVETVADRLSPSWLAGAQHIRTATRLILYHGQATGSYSADGKNWTGEIEGEVLVLQEHSAHASPRVQLLPDGAIEMIGLSNTVLDHSGLSAEQVAAWHKLFAEKSPSRA